jgi:lipopolysaccharide/colanic/teichoic acid biosynthesis glycosyltransferase
MEIGMSGVEPYVTTDDFPVVEQKRIYEAVKRIQDFTMALMALVLLSPLWLLFALIIKLTSSGPAIYKQTEALGRYGRRITMYKFRTMYADMDNAHHKEAIAKFVQGEHLDTIQKDGQKLRVYKITRDPRVTSVGRILRKSGLDEIPQLVNVLRGELSIVGPRPPLVYEYELYSKEHGRRLEVLPGITGLYQVTARSQVPFEKMVEIDMDYIRRRSYWLDLKIILMTPWVLLTGMGAY